MASADLFAVDGEDRLADLSPGRGLVEVEFEPAGVSHARGAASSRSGTRFAEIDLDQRGLLATSSAAGG